MNNTVHKIIDIEQYQTKSLKPKEFQVDEYEILNEISIKLRDIVNNKVEEQTRNQLRNTPHKIELERKCNIMKNKLKHAIPYHTIIYMSITSAVFVVSIIMLYLRFFKSLYVIDSYYLVCSCLISLGLFLTAVVSLKDWKEFLQKNE